MKNIYVLKISLHLALFSAPAFSESPTKTQLNFFSKDGTRLYGEYYPAQDTKAVMLVVHGLQSHSGWYMNGAANAERGIASFAFDRRGSGLSDGKHGHAENVDAFMQDFEAALNFVQQKHLDLPVHVMANSLGSVIALEYFTRYKDPRVASLILTTPGTYSTREGDYSFLTKLAILTAPPMNYFQSPIRDEHFVDEGNFLDWIHGDPLSRRQFTASFLRAVTVMKTNLDSDTNEIDIPLFALMAKGDEIIDNAAFEEEIFDPYRAEKLIKYYDSKHYLFFGADRDYVASDIQDWVLSH